MNRVRVFLNVWRTVYQKSTGGVLLLAILLSNLGFLLTPFHAAMAAQVTLDNSVSTASTEHIIAGSATVFISDQVGYKFYVDNPGTCVYSKTTNGGTSWGTAVVVNSLNTCFGIVVWYDRWTPGDNGNNIHILV
jgi:hypothetical protein